MESRKNSLYFFVSSHRKALRLNVKRIDQLAIVLLFLCTALEKKLNKRAYGNTEKS